MKEAVLAELREEYDRLDQRRRAIELILAAYDVPVGPAAETGVTPVTSVTPRNGARQAATLKNPPKEETDGRTDGRSKKEASPARGGKDDGARVSGEWIRAQRKKAGLTQAQLAEAMGVSGSFIGNIETGTEKAPLNFERRVKEAIEVAKERKL